ncbi:hypothetical protein [Marinobacter sp.]|uniref:hypothetical protein n=1 Tax=Marinobacter sp. TaxID=50741 RepID=UPI0035C69400
MARSRNIKPGFFRNEHLVELPFETRLLFIGLWTLADKEGRLEFRPKKIKLELFPADDIDVSREISRLFTAGLVTVYQVEGSQLIEVVNFKKHQNPHPKEAASEIPGPDDERAQPVDFMEAAKSNGKPCNFAASNADSLLLIPDSCFPSNGTSESDAPCEAKPPAKSKAKTATYPESFEEFWATMPKRPGSNPKRDAFGCYQARLKENHSADEILAGAKRYHVYLEAIGNLNTPYVMQAKRFLGPALEFTNDWTPPPSVRPLGSMSREAALEERSDQTAEEWARGEDWA